MVENHQSPTRHNTPRERRSSSNLQISTKSLSRPQSVYTNSNSPSLNPLRTPTSPNPLRTPTSPIGKIIKKGISSPRPQLDKVIEDSALKITLHPSNDNHRPPQNTHVAAWITDVSKQALTVEPAKTERHSHRRRQSNVERISARRPNSALIHDELPTRQDSGWAKDTLLALSEDYQPLSNLINNSYPSPTTPPPKGPGEFYMINSGNRNGSSSSLNKVFPKRHHGDQVKSSSSHHRVSNHNKSFQRPDSSGSEIWRGHRRENSSGSSAGSHRSYHASSSNNSAVQMMHPQGMRSRDSLNAGFSSSSSSTPINPRRRTSMENVSNRGSVYISQQSKHRTR
ncbi:10770_t:CDS:2 [Ambispora gerdemannii]|uniref:10770_t:CDS:1 n=1 Tax=Ambispora gerdemannii TaxID=144530 RepID=A0A9N8W106_9GLOM|nr:10770_t:CDS:2 [Ambispora gerdemannii]